MGSFGCDGHDDSIKKLGTQRSSTTRPLDRDDAELGQSKSTPRCSLSQKVYIAHSGLDAIGCSVGAPLHARLGLPRRFSDRVFHYPYPSAYDRGDPFHRS